MDPFEVSFETGEDKPEDTSTGQRQDELLKAYRDQVEFLRWELERKDTLLMPLMQRIPELEYRSELRYTPRQPQLHNRVQQVALGATESTQEPTQWRSWLYRFFFGA